MVQGDLTDAEWQRLAPLLPPGGGRAGGWLTTAGRSTGSVTGSGGLPWRDLPTEFGEWITAYERFQRWSADGTWHRLQDVVQAEADATTDIEAGTGARPA